MSATGYIQVRAYTSSAQYPLKNVAIAITATDGTAIAMRLTDHPTERPYTVVNLYAHLTGYEQTEAENLQVFAGITTVQNLEMIPLSELPDAWDQTVVFDTPPQNL